MSYFLIANTNLCTSLCCLPLLPVSSLKEKSFLPLIWKYCNEFPAQSVSLNCLENLKDKMKYRKYHMVLKVLLWEKKTDSEKTWKNVLYDQTLFFFINTTFNWKITMQYSIKYRTYRDDFYWTNFSYFPLTFLFWRGRRGHDRMVVGFITTYAIGAYHH